MRPILIFAAACFCTFLLVCAITVFGLDQFEHAWGPWKSFEVEAWVSAIGAFVAMGAFGIASAFLHRSHSERAALALGVGGSGLFVAVCWAFSGVEFDGGAYAALALLIALSCLAAYAGQRTDTDDPARRSV
jgi:hypothetical protein